MGGRSGGQLLDVYIWINGDIVWRKTIPKQVNKGLIPRCNSGANLRWWPLTWHKFEQGMSSLQHTHCNLEYTYRDTSCIHCGEEDTAESTALLRRKWNFVQEEMDNTLTRALTPKNLGEEMTFTEQKWKIIHMFRRIMRIKSITSVYDKQMTYISRTFNRAKSSRRSEKSHKEQFIVPLSTLRADYVQKKANYK